MEMQTDAMMLRIRKAQVAVWNAQIPFHIDIDEGEKNNYKTRSIIEVLMMMMIINEHKSTILQQFIHFHYAFCLQFNSKLLFIQIHVCLCNRI